MSDENKNLDELDNLKDFSARYKHYLETNDDDKPEYTKEENINPGSQFEDISSYSNNAEGMNELFSNASDNAAYEEIESDITENDVPKKKKNEGFFSKNHHRNAKITALVLVIVLLLGSGGFLLWFWFSTKGVDYKNKGLDINDPSKMEQVIYDEEQHKSMGDVHDSASLNEWLKNWALNGGEKMSSKNVINVLLCGVDSTDGTASDARSDSMIIVSINKKTKTISMISLLRDSWTYMSLPRDDGSHYDYYFKMNAAYRFGGPATLMETIEDDLKIEIDQYIAVDFKSFKKLIDALGGVTVEVTQAESNYIRRTSSQKNFPVGKAKLSGKEALIYSRIRYLDDDLMRTGRQRKIIKALIDSAKTATNGQLLNAFKQVSGYMRTGYSQSEVMSLIAQAYTYKWMDYDMKELMIPNQDYVDRFSTYIGTQWVWVVDFVLCAKSVQETIYGESNIILAEDRVSALDFVTKKKITSSNNSSSSGSNSSSGNRYDNDDDYDYKRTTSRRYYDDDDEEPVRTTKHSSSDNDEEPVEKTSSGHVEEPDNNQEAENNADSSEE
ncbi:MAG: LCP family protein [Clostridia bacterium]|nr:LCP family protein [Clostridia bacterium]